MRLWQSAQKKAGRGSRESLFLIHGATPPKTTPTGVCRAAGIAVRRSTPLVIAARKMERHAIHRLVVVDDADETIPIGVLSMTDLIHAIAEETGASR